MTKIAPSRPLPPNDTAIPSDEFLREAMIGVLPALRARARCLTRDEVIAEDVVQDTVERALRFADSFEPGTNVRAWLQQVLFSVFVTRCRRRQRERRALDRLTTDPCAWTQRDPAPVERSLTPGIEAAIAALPEQFAQVIRLVDLQDHSYKDAAQILGVPVGTVMSRLFRGRRLLAAALRDDLPLAA